MSRKTLATGADRRRYERARGDVTALRGSTVDETQANITVAAVVNTLHRLGATGVNHGSYAPSLRKPWWFSARLQDGTSYLGVHMAALDEPPGIALMHAGANLIRHVLEGQEW